MSVSAPTVQPAAELVGNPRRVRGLDASMLIQPEPQPEPTLVGNPRRLRNLTVEDFQAA